MSNWLPDIEMIDPRKRHLFSVTISDDNLAMETPQCMTCNRPSGCQYVSASFSYSGKYYILECLGPDIPSYMLKSTVDDRGKHHFHVQIQQQFL